MRGVKAVEEKKNVPMIRMDQVSMQYSTGVDAFCIRKY